jgi:hypothetical protein
MLFCNQKKLNKKIKFDQSDIKQAKGAKTQA